MNIETDFLRRYLVSLSLNSFRKAFVISASSFMDYAEYIQAQANKITWVKQVESREIQSFSLFYVLLKKMILDILSMRSVVKLMLELKIIDLVSILFSLIFLLFFPNFY